MQDVAIEFFLNHGVARIHRGASYAVELVGQFLNTDRETLPTAILDETARKYGITRERLMNELKQFSQYIGKHDPELYQELVGEQFKAIAFIHAASEAVFQHYRDRHTLL